MLDEGLDKLKVFTNLNGKEIRLIVGGGDGTIGSVGNYIKSEIPEWMEKNPPIATLPLGTGNDLSNKKIILIYLCMSELKNLIKFYKYIF